MDTKIIEYISKFRLKRKSLINFLIIIFILLTSFFTRFYNLGEAKSYIFDENFFIPIALNYQEGEFFGDPHPPLGRLLITASASIFSSESFDFEPLTKYRIAPAFFGSLIPLTIYLILKLLTRSELFSFIGSLLLIFDNALLVHARFALFDEILIFFTFTSILFSLLYVMKVKSKSSEIFEIKNVAARILILIVAGSFAGAALATKLTGLTATAFLILAILYKTYKDKYKLNASTALFIFTQLLISFIAVLGIFFLSFKIHFELLKSPGKNLEEFSEEFQNCFQGENSDCKLNLFELTNEQIQWSFNYESLVPEVDFCKEGEMGSIPTQWPFMARAIPYAFTNHGGIPLSTVSYIYLVGNPVVWSLGLLSLIISFSLLFSSLFFVSSFINKNILFLLFGFLLNYIPYFFIDRVMYFYHYFPSFIFSIMLFSVLLKLFYDLHIKNKVQKLLQVLLLTIFLLIVFIGFLAYSPLSYGRKVNVNYVEKLILTDFWNLKVDPYNYEKQ